MRLATIAPDGSAQCILCQWKYKAPTKRRKRLGVVEDLTIQERFKMLEDNILSHLRYGHDRVLLTKEEIPPGEEGMLGRVYYNGRRYNGRRPERLRW